MRHEPMRAMHARIAFNPLPIHPWDYIRMRREAAGLTIDQIAPLFYANEDHRADVIRNIRAMEQPDFKPPYPGYDAADMLRAFPLSTEVYRQLHEDPRFHPRLCLSCGWDEWSEQYDLQGFSTAWSIHHRGICTRCEQIMERGDRH
ncbi:MAG TPA: hypothetical protein VF503_20200 [Sphingobium sp.]|uniref:hypothetical protein n=1 Tax=Sphingobium sp. TaxID=1912891 RepID=UPI002ED12AF1